jgi:hypothetical protein
MYVAKYVVKYVCGKVCRPYVVPKNKNKICGKVCRPYVVPMGKLHGVNVLVKYVHVSMYVVMDVVPMGTSPQCTVLVLRRCVL